MLGVNEASDFGHQKYIKNKVTVFKKIISSLIFTTTNIFSEFAYIRYVLMSLHDSFTKPWLILSK